MEENNKKKTTGQILIYFVLVPFLSILCVVLGVATINNMRQLTQASEYMKEAYVTMQEQDAKIKELESKSTKKSVSNKIYNFKSGNYVAGEDFEAGTYNLIATGGFGNVIADDLSLNCIMGVKEKDTLDVAEQEYQNVTFKDGVTLKIDGAEIRLKKVK